MYIFYIQKNINLFFQETIKSGKNRALYNKETIIIYYKEKFMKQEIYNPDGSLRAVIYQFSGRTEIYDASGSLQGVYNHDTNETHNAYGQFVGRGNLLMTLI